MSKTSQRTSPSGTQSATQSVPAPDLSESSDPRFPSKDAEKAAAAVPAAELAAYRERVEHMFDDLPPWQREGAIKKEKKRILDEEGIQL